MSRLPGSPAVGQAPKAPADIYTVLLLVSTIMMLWAGIAVFLSLSGDFGLSFSEIFSGASLPK